MKRQYQTPRVELLAIQQESAICAVSALHMGGSGDATQGRAPKRGSF